MSAAFEYVDLSLVPLVPMQAHEGVGQIGFRRLATAEQLGGAVHFLDLAVLAPGTSIGSHTHAPHEEEFYLVLQGSGMMVRNGEPLRVHAGMLVRNPPGGEHELRNDGVDELRVFVFEVEAT